MSEKLAQHLADTFNRRSFLTKASLGLGSMASRCLIAPKSFFYTNRATGIDGPESPAKGQTGGVYVPERWTIATGTV